MNGTEDTFGSSITFGCNVGYRLDGDGMIECLPSGSWSANVPVCTIIGTYTSKSRSFQQLKITDSSKVISHFAKVDLP